MENRDKDKVSRNTESTPAGDVNRKTSSHIKKEQDESSVGFGGKTGQPEHGTPGKSPSEEGIGSTGTGRSGSTGMGPGTKPVNTRNRGGEGSSEGRH